MLRSYCLSVVLCNLDAVLIEARGAFEALPPHLLDEMERLWKLRLAGSEPADREVAAARGAAAERNEAGLAPTPAGPEASASPVAIQWQSSLGITVQPGRRPSAAPPALGEQHWCGAEEDGVAPMRASPASATSLGLALGGESSFRGHESEATADAVGRLKRTLHKKLQQIGSLEARAADGTALDAQQQAKVAARPVVEAALAALEGGMAVEEVQSILRAGTGAAASEGPADVAVPRGSTGKAGKAGKAKGKGGSKGKGAAPAGEAYKLSVQLSELALAEPSGLLDTPSRGASEAAELLVAPADGAAEPTNSMYGASPPAAALLPAFGLGERLVQQQQQHSSSNTSGPSAATAAPGASPASPPMTTQVGFATRSGVLPAEQQQPRSSGKVRDSSTRAKRKGEKQQRVQ